MFEAKLQDGSILKRIVEAIKDVVNDVNIDVSPSGKHLTFHFQSDFFVLTPMRQSQSHGIIVADFCAQN